MSDGIAKVQLFPNMFGIQGWARIICSPHTSFQLYSAAPVHDCLGRNREGELKVIRFSVITEAHAALN